MIVAPGIAMPFAAKPHFPEVFVMSGGAHRYGLTGARERQSEAPWMPFQSRRNRLLGTSIMFASINVAMRLAKSSGRLAP